MKKYLLGLGAMLVGAGLMLMFVLIVEMGIEPEYFACDDNSKSFVTHCETTKLDCAWTRTSVSCVKKGLFW